MRLIDADSLRDRASEYVLSNDEYERFCKIIKTEPTAYDVDAVVKELEDSIVCGMFGACFDKDEMEIIDIVKNGGASNGRRKRTSL